MPKVSQKILMIGGAGFVGSHTADVLSERGYHVTIFDEVASPWLRDDQVMVVAKIDDEDALERAMQGVAIVYHFAGIADIAESKQKPSETIELNVMGTVRILELAIKHGVSRFVFASTMYVYSESGSFYRASKQAAETLIEAYAKEFDIEYTMLRYGSLYGPRAQDWNGIQKFVKQIIEDGYIEYGGTGNELREYIHVRDAAELSVDILSEEYVNSALTVTGLQIYRVDQLISMLFEIIGIEPNCTFAGAVSKEDHYGQTPYRFSPKPAKKLVPTKFVDIGQGLLDVIQEVYVEKNGSKSETL